MIVVACYFSILLGVAGAGLATSAAIVVDQPEINKQVLFGTAGFLTLSSFLNMKPTGDPTPTGESRLLRKTGTITETDTVRAAPIAGNAPSYTVYYNREAIVLRNDIPYVNGSYSINLIDELNPENFEYDSSDAITLEVYFNDVTYQETIALSDFFESFVVVSSDVTALRDEPELDSRNILTDLANGSQMKLVSEDSLWYKVLYGISETWISKSDAYPIWRPSEFASQLNIIAIPNIPFGNVDIESNIPRLTSQNDSAYAFVIANREYQGAYSERTYAERDARLMEEYFQNALSIPANHIYRAINVETRQQLARAYNRLATSLRSEQKRLIVYVSGYVKTGINDDVLLLGTNRGSNEQELNLNAFFEGLSKLPVKEIVVFADLDNVDEKAEQGYIEKLGNQIVDNQPNSAVIFASTEIQNSGMYSVPNGEQKRHSIFTYFIADALKNRQSDITALVNHLQRNVDYTSRKLHNRPQHIVYIGKSDISLVD